MQVVKESGPTFLGITMGPDKFLLKLNKREIQTLTNAYQIREEARDRMRDLMGSEDFDANSLYTLDIDDLLDSPTIHFMDDYSRLGE